jgi:hypothetical protein
MRKLLFIMLMYSISAFSQNVGINTDGTTPDVDALLHIKNTTLSGAEPATLLRIQNTLNGANDRTGLQLYNSNTANSRWSLYVPGAGATDIRIKNHGLTSATLRLEPSLWNANGHSFKIEFGATDHYITTIYNTGLRLYTNDAFEIYTGDASGANTGRLRFQIEETNIITNVNLRAENWTAAGHYVKLRFHDDNHYILGEWGRGMIFNDGNKFNFTTSNVGINQELPEWKLQVTSAASNSATAMQVTNTDKSRYLTVFSGSNNADDTPAIVWGNRGSGSSKTDGNTIRLGSWTSSNGGGWQHNYSFYGDGNASYITMFKNGYQGDATASGNFTIDIRTNVTTDFQGTVVINDALAISDGDALTSYMEIKSGWDPIVGAANPAIGYIDIHGDKTLYIGDDLIPFNVTSRKLGDGGQERTRWSSSHIQSGYFYSDDTPNTGMIIKRNSSGFETCFGYAGSDDNPNIYFNGTMRAYIDRSSGTWNGVSDIRLKQNIKNLEYGINEIMLISPKSYTFISDSTDKKYLGFVAQELYNVIPEAVNIGGTDVSTNPWTINNETIIPVLINAIQEQQKQIQNLQSQIFLLQQK